MGQAMSLLAVGVLGVGVAVVIGTGARSWSHAQWERKHCRTVAVENVYHGGGILLAPGAMASSPVPMPGRELVCR